MSGAEVLGDGKYAQLAILHFVRHTLELARASEATLIVHLLKWALFTVKHFHYVSPGLLEREGKR